MRPTYYFLSSIGTHVTIAASCPATALQASVSFITLSVNRLILGFVIPMLLLARKGRPTLSLSTSEATDPLWGQLSVENWELLRHRCDWTQARYIDGLQQTVHAMLVDSTNT